MGIVAAGLIIGAGATVYSAVEQRKSAKQQAAQVAENARQASAQASEAARGNALAAQTASDRQQAQDKAAADAKLNDASLAVTPDVQISAAGDPAEAARRRLVRASFTPDEQPAAGAIRI